MIDYRLAEAGVAATRGDFETTERQARECWTSSSELGALSCATISGIVLGGAQVAAGHGLDAKPTLERSVELARQGFMAPMLPRANVYLASARAQLGEAGSTEAGYLAAIEALTAAGNRYGLAEAQVHLGMMLASRTDDDLEGALSSLDASRSIFEELGARPDLARTERSRGMVLGRLGRTEEADAALGVAAALATEMDLHDGPWPATFEAAAADLASRQAMGGTGTH
jgi:tetratricopeptide (TPR) repeat protein